MPPKNNEFDEITIKNHRPNLSDSSLRTYKSILTNLFKRMKPDQTIYDKNYFINHPRDVIRFLKDIKPNLRKTSLSALTVYTLSDKNVSDIFRDQMLRDGKIYKENIESQEMTDKQRANWITQDEIKKIYVSLEKVIKPIFNNYEEGDNIPIKDLERIQDYIIASIYVLIPPRRLTDYSEFKMKDINEDEDNYMKNGTFYFNKFKTAKFKKDSFKIPIKLKNIIQKWGKLTNSEWLLFQSRNKAKKISPSFLNTILHRIFGGSISVNNLRHSYLTEYFKDVPTLTDIKHINDQMGHSLVQSLEYVKK